MHLVRRHRAGPRSCSVSEDRMAAAGAMLTSIFSHAAASLALVADAGAHICRGTGGPDCTFRRQHVCRDHQASSWMVGNTEEIQVGTCA
jgi:hypothetical protein